MSSPISNLPSEILVAVFQAGISVESQWASKGLQSLPVIVSQVCRLWRSIAMDSAELWSIIYVDLGDQISYLHAKVYVARSHGRALQVQIDCTKEDDESMERVDLITDMAPRISELIITVRTMSMVEILLAAVDGAPLLRRLEYEVIKDDHERKHRLWDFPHKPSAQLPALQHLKANRGCSGCAPRLEGIVYLHITQLPPSALAGVIRDCPSLETLVLPRFKPWDNAGLVQALAPVESPTIKRFAVEMMRSATVGPCVSLLMPNLEYLEILDDRETTSDELSQIFPASTNMSDSSNPFPRLHALHLHGGIDFRRSLSLAFLRSLASVRHLILTNIYSLPTCREYWPDLQSVHIDTVLFDGESSTGLFLTPGDVKIFAEARGVDIVVTDDESVRADLPFQRLPPGEYGLITSAGEYDEFDSEVELDLLDGLEYATEWDDESEDYDDDYYDDI
ncbi:hypothetical protein HDZ31DRAFT_29529 [Schizophyllum fasciatum]